MYSPPGEVDPIHSSSFWTNCLAMQKVNDFRRSDKLSILEKLVASRNITQDGKEWLVAALDPFHDYNHQIAGYPDADVSQTVVSCYQYEASITAPTNVATTWNAHIFSTPNMQPADAGPVYTESADWSKIIDPAVPLTYKTGPIVARSYLPGFAGGGGVAIPHPVAADYSDAILPPSGNTDLSAGCSRVIGIGFEVHNTTAEIYKQGAVTTYRMPQNYADNQALFTNNAGPPPTSYGTIFGKRMRMPPSSIAEANLLRGTRTWEAKDGVYATVFQSRVNNPLLTMSCEQGLFDPLGSPSGATSIVWGTPLNVGVPAGLPLTYTPAASQFMPFDTTGAFFTGLSPQTVLTLKVRFYVERAPTWNDTNLAPLASPSANYDVAALELYAAAINMLPCAVQVAENAHGDWWRSVLKVLGHVAGPVGSIMNTMVPGAGLVGNALGAMMGQLDISKPISTQATAKSIAQRPRPKSAPTGPKYLEKKKKIKIARK
jgi:hypothetical protein